MIMKLTNGKVIYPLQDYVFVELYNENPYKELRQGVLITSTSEITEDGDGTTGNKVELEQTIKCGIIVEVGQYCTTLEVGDEVYFDNRGALPVPVGGTRIVRLNERNIMAFVRDAD